MKSFTETASPSCLESMTPRALPSLMAHLLRWHRRRRDAALLMQQPDYMLRDIGIGRSEIEYAVRGGVRCRR